MQYYTTVTIVKYEKIKTYLGRQLTPNDIFIEYLSIDCHYV